MDNVSWLCVGCIDRSNISFEGTSWYEVFNPTPANFLEVTPCRENPLFAVGWIPGNAFKGFIFSRIWSRIWSPIVVILILGVTELLDKLYSFSTNTSCPSLSCDFFSILADTICSSILKTSYKFLLRISLPPAAQSSACVLVNSGEDKRDVAFFLEFIHPSFLQPFICVWSAFFVGHPCPSFYNRHSNFITLAIFL